MPTALAEPREWSRRRSIVRAVAQLGEREIAQCITGGAAVTRGAADEPVEEEFFGGGGHRVLFQLDRRAFGGDGEAIAVGRAAGLVAIGGGSVLAVAAFGLGKGLVGVGVDASLPQLLLNARIPQVLYLVIRPSWQLRCDLRPPDHHSLAEAKDERLFE